DHVGPGKKHRTRYTHAARRQRGHQRPKAARRVAPARDESGDSDHDASRSEGNHQPADEMRMDANHAWKSLGERLCQTLTKATPITSIPPAGRPSTKPASIINGVAMTDLIGNRHGHPGVALAATQNV